MIDEYDATHDGLRLAVARGVQTYSEQELLDALNDRNAILRTAAARQLHLRGDRHVFEKMKMLSVAPRHESREIAAFVLGQLGNPTCPFATESFPIFLSLLDDHYSEVRSAAIVGLASLSMLGKKLPANLIERIAAIANDEDPEVRATIANTIELVDRTLAENVLNKLKEDDDPGVRSAARSACSETS